ncbi:MAG: 2-alkenal reductase [Tepidiforma sp.]|nr:MAG: 2-alkenal reductase [Tepidiforma sp.]
MPRQRNGTLSVLVLAGSLVASALLGGVIGGLVVLQFDDSGAGPAPTAASTPTLPLDVTTAVSEAVTRARPAVVRVESATRRTFDVGSGVVISSEGYIVTNAHVVLDTDQLKVVFEDGSERPAVLIGHDYPFNDIAVLQVAPVGLTAIEIGDSAALQPGETVIAIGNPLGELYGSVTVGVVSGVNRSRLLDGVRHDDIIQTDAAVNSGNSGGALVNLAGQLVGIPTTILRQSSTGQSVEGVAFAIPSSRAVDIANRIIAARGPIPRPSLELEHLDLNEEVAARLPALATSTGAVVLTIAQGGVAAAAGIRAGDVITEFGGMAIDARTPLLNALMEHQPGETVKVVLNRNGRIIETEVRLAKRS